MSWGSLRQIFVVAPVASVRATSSVASEATVERMPLSSCLSDALSRLSTWISKALSRRRW
jgi:hypothetical protein